MLQRTDPQLQKPLQAAQWQTLRVLLDEKEMAELLVEVGPETHFYLVSSPVRKGKSLITSEEFLTAWKSYVCSLQKGELPDLNRVKKLFSSAWSVTPSALYEIPIAEGEVLIRPCAPVVQLQMHRFQYTEHDQKIRSMVFGPNSITWGIQFAFPSLFQEPHTGETLRTHNHKQFPNAALFRKIQRTLRDLAPPVTLRIGSETLSTALRLGKRCREWISHHPQLRELGWRIEL